jgi:hypothetical protein
MKKAGQLSAEEILSEFGAPAVEKSLAASKAFYPEWTIPDILLTSNRWKSRMTKDEAVELCLICQGVEQLDGLVTYRVITLDGVRGGQFGNWYCVERLVDGVFTHFVVPLDFQFELQEWKRRLDSGEQTT